MNIWPSCHQFIKVTTFGASQLCRKEFILRGNYLVPWCYLSFWLVAYFSVILSHNFYFLLLGPGIEPEDEETFNKYCIFSNHVKMSADQASLLRDQVEAAQKLDIPYYVCTMRKSHAKPRMYKMVNTLDYISFYPKWASQAVITSDIFTRSFRRSLRPTTLQIHQGPSWSASLFTTSCLWWLLWWCTIQDWHVWVGHYYF